MKRDPRKILVFQTAFLGDALLAIPLLKTIKNKWPNSQLAIVCRRGVGEILIHGSGVDQIIEVDKNSRLSLKKAFKQTKEFKADFIISPHSSFRTALWVARLRAKISVGFRKPWNFFAFSYRVVKLMEAHDVLRQLSLLKPFGVDVDQLSDELKTLTLRIQDSPRFKDLTHFGVLSPGSQWNTKRWTTQGYIEVGKQLELSGRKVVLVGTSSEDSLCKEIANSLLHVTNLSGQTTVMELAQVLKKADVVFCNDSGTMHVASTVGTPIVSVFGPTVPSQGYAPWSKKNRIAEVALGCRPCGAHGHDTCPIGTHDCMKKVSGEFVWKKAQELI